MTSRKPLPFRAFIVIFLSVCAICGCENDQERAIERLRNYTTQIGARGAGDYAKLKQIGKVDQMCQQAIYVTDVYEKEPREPETSRWRAIAEADCKKAGLPLPIYWNLALRARPHPTKESMALGDAWPATTFAALSAEYLNNPSAFTEKHRGELFKLSGRILSGVGESASPLVFFDAPGSQPYTAQFLPDTTMYALRPDDIIQFTCGRFSVSGMSGCRLHVLSEADIKADSQRNHP